MQRNATNRPIVYIPGITVLHIPHTRKATSQSNAVRAKEINSLLKYQRGLCILCIRHYAMFDFCIYKRTHERINQELYRHANINSYTPTAQTIIRSHILSVQQLNKTNKQIPLIIDPQYIIQRPFFLYVINRNT